MGNASLSRATQLSSPRADVAVPVIRPLDPVMGAEVMGIDVSRSMSPEVHALLEEAFNTYHVLCFRDQMLTTDSLVAFTRTWGTPGEHTMPGQVREGIVDVNIASNADEHGRPNGQHPDPTSMRWHTDRSWRRDPVTATLLYGVEVPSEGGDTLFCNTAKAYAALPTEMQRRLEGMRAIHSVEYSRLTGGGHRATEYELSIAPPQPHPLARVHPANGAQALYLGCHVWMIEGMSESDGRKLIDELTAFSTQEDFVYRHKWRQHDLLMWDNRCTMHSATPYDASAHLRTMYRTVVAGGPTH